MEPRKPAYIPRRAWFAVGVAVLILVLLIRSNSTILVDGYPRVDSYRVVGQRSIVLTVAVAPRSWTRITAVRENETEVRVTAESLDWPIPIPGTDDLELRNLTVSLSEDLGARVVRDANGRPIPAE